MKHLKFYLLLLSCIALQGCKEDKRSHPSTINKIQKDSLYIAEPIQILAVSDDERALEYFNFINYANINGWNSDGQSKSILGDTTKFTFKNIEEPQIAEFFSFGDSANINTRIFVSPGDSVVLTIANGRISFSGKNSTHYQFFTELDSTNTEWASNKFDGNFEKYKQRSKVIHERRQNFLQEYIDTHEVSQDFINEVMTELRFEYLYNLIAPRSIPSVLPGININNDDFAEVLTNAVYDTEKNGILDLQSYLDSITIEEFNTPELLSNDYYQRSLMALIRNYFTGHAFISYSAENFIKEKQYIENNLEGEIRDYALISLIIDYYDKGLGQGSYETKLVKNFTQNLLDKTVKPDYKEKLRIILEDLAMRSYELPPTAKNDSLVNIYRDTITIAQILENTRNRIRIIDFWASWCAPCIKEIKNTVAFRDELRQRYGLEWIFISLDKGDPKWNNTLQKLARYFENDNQFRLLNINDSKIVNFLTKGNRKNFMIPRYVIIGSNNEIVTTSAPRPSDSLIFKNLLDKIAKPGK